MVSPILCYYSRPNASAEKEFDVVSLVIVEFLEAHGYLSFHVGMMHVGFEKESAVPAVLVCAKGFEEDHAREAILLFQSVGCVSLLRMFCFQGVTENCGSADYLKYHQQSPEMGASIGVTDRTIFESSIPQLLRQSIEKPTRSVQY
jgi:hypothetical protein